MSREAREKLDAERKRCQSMPADVCAERCDWFCIATIEDEGDELAPGGT